MNLITRARIAAAGALAAAVVASAPAAAADSEYIPFVTDFPKPAAVPPAAPQASSDGFDWAGTGAGVGAALTVVLAGAGLALARRSRPVRA
jgi:hypothetical protein